MCPDREITFACQQPLHSGTGALQWDITISSTTSTAESILYQATTPLGISEPLDGDQFNFMSVLVNTSPTLNSTLTVRADEQLNGTVVTCIGLIQQVDTYSTIINIASKC